jgi:RHS repeat-associated protein
VVVERQGDRAIRYGYSTRGVRIERVMPDGATTCYAYDALDALVGVQHGGHELRIERDLLGCETRRGDAAGRLSIQSAYDAMDRLIEQRAMAPAPGGGVPAVLVQRQWQYDKGGRVARIDDARWGATTYAHDKVDQLVEARRGALREVFEYDAAGSLVKMLEGLDAEPQAEPAWEIQAGNLVKRTSEAKYSYDKRGRRTDKIELSRFANGANPTRDDVTQYFWDCRDRLREVKLAGGTRVVMTYDAFGRRVRKEVVPKSPAERPRAVEFVWDGDALAVDIDTERGARCFVHEPGTLIPLLQQERGEVFTYVNDHLGMPKELLDPAGRMAWAAAHSAWGKVVETTADRMGEMNRGRRVEAPFRLLGQVADEDTGLCWTRFRCFDPEVGRWMSPDPLGIASGSDLFGFDGSPTHHVDPLGLATGSPHGTEKPKLEHAKNFDEARKKAFQRAGMTDPSKVGFSKVDPKTGTVVEFKGPGGAKVAYDSPHADPGPGHDMPHVGWQSAGKRGSGGTERGNITYDGPQHPFRSSNKGEGVL